MQHIIINQVYLSSATCNSSIKHAINIQTIASIRHIVVVAVQSKVKFRFTDQANSPLFLIFIKK